MNREIKFRAWNKHNKKMYYKVMVGMWGSKEVMDDENYTACMLYEYSNDNPKIGEWLHFEPYDDIELMQYTGHKDKKIPKRTSFLEKNFIYLYKLGFCFDFEGDVIMYNSYNDTFSLQLQKQYGE